MNKMSASTHAAFMKYGVCKQATVHVLQTYMSQSLFNSATKISKALVHPVITRQLTVTCVHNQKNDRDNGSEEEEFRTYEIPGLKPVEHRRMTRPRRPLPVVPPPRYLKMRPDQDWTAVWPAAASFNWSVVPFPVRQGFLKNLGENKGLVPGKYANSELVKIPNFLHLTPKHVKQQTAAIKQFCSKWPDTLSTDDDCRKHFPMEVISSDFCFSGPSIRDPRARTITLQVALSALDLDYHARDKLIRLVGTRYNHNTDEISIVTDRCPLKKQNYDYAVYLLTVLFNESWVVADWESDKTEADMEKYVWDNSPSKTNILSLMKKMHQIDTEKEYAVPLGETAAPPGGNESLLQQEPMQRYMHAVTDLHNEGENHATLESYKQAVLTLLQVKQSEIGNVIQ